MDCVFQLIFNSPNMCRHSFVRTRQNKIPGCDIQESIQVKTSLNRFVLVNWCLSNLPRLFKAMKRAGPTLFKPAWPNLRSLSTDLTQICFISHNVSWAYFYIISRTTNIKSDSTSLKREWIQTSNSISSTQVQHNSAPHYSSSIPIINESLSFQPRPIAAKAKHQDARRWRRTGKQKVVVANWDLKEQRFCWPFIKSQVNCCRVGARSPKPNPPTL